MALTYMITHKQAGYGSFVRPHNVAVGDYPERGIEDEEEEEDEI
jgi:hypothetical protein